MPVIGIGRGIHCFHGGTVSRGHSMRSSTACAKAGYARLALRQIEAPAVDALIPVGQHKTEIVIQLAVTKYW